MANEDRYNDFLKEILRRTKDNELSWKYLDREKWLYEGMDWVECSSRIGISGEQIIFYPDFDVENSFCCQIDGTFLVIFVRYNQPAVFYIIPNTLKNVVMLTADVYGALITRLLNMVRSFFPDGEAFIDSVLQGKR